MKGHPMTTHDRDALPLAIAKACGIPTEHLVALSAHFAVDEVPRITATFVTQGTEVGDINTITEQWTPAVAKETP